MKIALYRHIEFGLIPVPLNAEFGDGGDNYIRVSGYAEVDFPVLRADEKKELARFKLEIKQSKLKALETKHLKELKILEKQIEAGDNE